MKKIFKNTFGFGLVEVLMAAGLAGGIALTVAKLSQDANRVTKTTESNNEINIMMNDVAYILSDKANCLATIPPGTNASGASLPSIDRVVSGTERNVYSVGQKYGNGTFSIGSIITEQIGPNDVNLILTINRENKTTTGAKSITKRIPLKVVTTGASIDSCFSNTENIITSAAERACRGSSAHWNAADGICEHEITPVNCDNGEAVKTTTTNDGEVVYTCAPVLAQQSCAVGEYVKNIRADGTLECVALAASVNCTAGQYAISLSNGQLGCVNIPQCGNQELLRTNSAGVFYCQGVPCNSANQYFAGFSSGGSPVCKNFPNSSCGAGQYIKEVRPNGTVICDTIATGASLPTVAYSFVDGYDVGTNTWSRKDINATAAQICSKFSGYSWTGTQCAPIGGVADRWTHETNKSTLTINGSKLEFTDQGVFSISGTTGLPTLAFKPSTSELHITRLGANAKDNYAGYYTIIKDNGLNVYDYPDAASSTLRGRIETETDQGIIFDPSITSTSFVEIADNSVCDRNTHGGRLRIARIPSTSRWRLFLCTTDDNITWRWQQLAI